MDVYKEHIVFRHTDSLVFVIQQDSIRFDPFKVLALYVDGHYYGNYRIIHKHVFTIKALTDIASLIFLGVRKKEGIQELLKYRIKGRVAESTKMAFLCLKWKKCEPKYDINRTYAKK